MGSRFDDRDEYYYEDEYYEDEHYEDYTEADPVVEAFFDNFQLFVIVPLGMFGSTMIIAVLCQEKNRKLPSSVYYIGLAISDFVLLLARQISHRATAHIMERAWWTVVIVCTDISSWLLVFVAAERALCVTYPQRVKFICTVVKAKMIVVGSVLFFVSVNCVRILACLSKCNRTFEHYIREVEQYYNFWITFAIPSLSITVTSIVIVVQLKRRRIRSTANSSRTISVTRTLIAVSIAFVMLMGPVRLYGWKTETEYVILEALQHMNPAVNFFLYGLTGSRFRTDFLQLFCKCCIKPENTPRTGSTSQHRSSTITRRTQNSVTNTPEQCSGHVPSVSANEVVQAEQVT